MTTTKLRIAFACHYAASIGCSWFLLGGNGAAAAVCGIVIANGWTLADMLRRDAADGDLESQMVLDGLFGSGHSLGTRFDLWLQVVAYLGFLPWLVEVNDDESEAH